MKKIDFEMASWLESHSKCDVFATVTFKQRLVFDDGSVNITRDHAETTCGFIRDRVFRKCKGKFRWITSIEDGRGEKRTHAHMAIRKPDGVSFEEFEKHFIDVCRRMHWVHEKIDVRPIVEGDDGAGSRKVIFYMFKEGVDALALGASHFSV